MLVYGIFIQNCFYMSHYFIIPALVNIVQTLKYISYNKQSSHFIMQTKIFLRDDNKRLQVFVLPGLLLNSPLILLYKNA